MNFAVFDLECTELRADTGFIICGGIKPLKGKPTIIGLADVKRCKDVMQVDKYLVAALRDELEKYDGIITWNGKLFDVPYLNTRLMLTKQRLLKPPFHIDAMWYARQGQSRFTSSRLDWVATQLGLTTQKTKLEMPVWMRARAEVLADFKSGRKNYDYIIEHNDKDLIVTEDTYEALKPFIKRVTR